MHMPLELSGIAKTHKGAPRPILSDLHLKVKKGEAVGLVGRSGCGKSSLLHLIAGIDQPDAGHILINGQNLNSLSDGRRTLLRRENIGLVFQFFHLLPHLTTVENILLPALIAGDRDKFRQRAMQLIEAVGLGPQADNKVSVLSGGEMQRVALCRALLRQPSLILADEPTGNLDESHRDTVMELLLRMAVEEGAAVIFVTHDLKLARQGDRFLRLEAGKLMDPEL